MGTTVVAPPWTESLIGFYQFLTDLNDAWRAQRGDVRTAQPEAAKSLLDVVSPKRVIIEPDDLKAPLLLINFVRRLKDQPPHRIDRGIGWIREDRFMSMLVDDVRSSVELARTARLVAVFRKHSTCHLLEYRELIDSELSAFENGLFSEAYLKRQVASAAVFGVGIAAAWSAIASYFLGLDILEAGWRYCVERVSSSLGCWSQVLAGGVFGMGLLGIVAWTAGRHRSLNQRYRLLKIRLCLNLYLRSESDAEHSGRTDAQTA